MAIVLKDFVTNEMLMKAGFAVRFKTNSPLINCAVKKVPHGELFIPLENTSFGNRIIQYNERGLYSDINLKKDLADIPSDWWEEVELPGEIVGRASFNSVEERQIRAIKTLLKNKLEDNAKLTGTEEDTVGHKYEDNLAKQILAIIEG